MSRKSLLFVCFVVLLFTALSFGGGAVQDVGSADDRRPVVDGQPYEVWESQLQEVGNPQAITGSGTDGFGYTWDDQVPFHWIDATQGTDTGMSGRSGGQYVGPIQLPFYFDFYENSYSELWINGSLLAFSEDDAGDYGPGIWPFPHNNWPNGIIAPLQGNYEFAEQGPENRVYYTSGGNIPNRYFVVEWHKVEPESASEGTFFQFQAVLYEHGDITFNYKEMKRGPNYQCLRLMAGIEDSRGINGFSTIDWCDPPRRLTSVHITRPPDHAGVHLTEAYQGSFTAAHDTQYKRIELTNNGTVGADTYNLAATSDWPIVLFDVDGSELTDTNGDGMIDTGPIEQGASGTVIVNVQAPTIVNPTDANNFVVNVASSQDMSVNVDSVIQLAVPAPFAQAFYEKEKAIYVAKADEQSAHGVLDSDSWSTDMSIAETADGGFIYVMPRSRLAYEDYGPSVYEILYSGLDADGNKRYPTKWLTFHGYPADEIRDREARVAVTPDGTAGIVWQRSVRDDAGRTNDNVFFATVDQAGNIKYGPVRLTQNDYFGSYGQLLVTKSASPSISATPDNRFFIAWSTNYFAAANDWVSNIEYMVVDSHGSTITKPTSLTSDAPGISWGYSQPNSASLAGDKVGIAFSSSSGSLHDVILVVMDGDGEVKNVSFFDPSGMPNGVPDIAHFPSGNTALAWTVMQAGDYRRINELVVLDKNYMPIAGPITLSHPAMRAFGPWSTGLSLTTTSTGQVAATWMDTDWDNFNNLYYAALNDDGSFATAPMIFRSAPGGLVTGLQGSSNTTLTIKRDFMAVDAHIEAPERNPARVNGTVSIPIRFGNRGAEEATEVEVTLTLGENLEYVGDDSGITPAEGSASPESTRAAEYTWAFPSSLEFLGNGRFDVYVAVKDGAVGQTYPVDLAISSAEYEGDEKDNEVRVVVEVVEQVLLPGVMR